MVDQLPNLGREKVMLEAMGMSSMDDLFADIPEHVKMTNELRFHLLNQKKKLSQMQEDYWARM